MADVFGPWDSGSPGLKKVIFVFPKFGPPRIWLVDLGSVALDHAESWISGWCTWRTQGPSKNCSNHAIFMCHERAADLQSRDCHKGWTCMHAVLALGTFRPPPKSHSVPGVCCKKHFYSGLPAFEKLCFCWTNTTDTDLGCRFAWWVTVVMKS